MKTPKRIQRTVGIEAELLERLRGATHYLAAYKPEAGVQSLSDIIEPGARDQLDRLEQLFNAGQPFPQVKRMQPGRPPKN